MGNMPPPRPQTATRRLRRSLVILLLLVLLLLGVAWQRWAIVDYIKLYGYTPPSQVVSLSRDTTMTQYAQHIFYVNHPAVDDRTAFNAACTTPEQTIVLGCYHPNQNGIYVFSVTDPRLQGVEQVTAAHEMLHAAYDRLSSSERNRVDTMLLDYYNHDLHDQRLLNTIANYKKTEPHDVVNEMHSVFGTEAAQLPASLEAYYSRYFTDRAKVVAYANSYQAEFTDRQQAVATDDQQLASLKSQIDGNKQTLASQQTALQTEQSQLDVKRSSDPAGYNAVVPQYNAGVDRYNLLASQTSALIASYNQLVAARNTLAVQVAQLAQAISSQPQVIQTQ